MCCTLAALHCTALKFVALNVIPSDDKLDRGAPLLFRDSPINLGNKNLIVPLSFIEATLWNIEKLILDKTSTTSNTRRLFQI